MKILRYLVVLLSVVPCYAGTIPLTGTIRTPQGNLLTGRIDMTLSYSAARDTTANNVIVAAKVTFPVRNGALPSNAQIVPNDILQPRNTTYGVEYFNNFGTKIAQNTFFVSGQSFNLGTAVPSTITTSNISFVPVSGIIGAIYVNCDGMDDTSILQAAITNAPSGSTVIFSGTCLISLGPVNAPTSLNLNKAGIHFRGSGPDSILRATGAVYGTGAPYFIWVTAPDVEMSDFTLDGNVSGVTFATTVGVANWGGMIVGYPAGGGTADRANLHDLVIKNFALGPLQGGNQRSGLGIDLFNAPYTTARNLQFINCNAGLFMSRDFNTTLTKYRVSNISGSDMTFPVVYAEFGKDDVVTNVVSTNKAGYTQAVSSSPNVGETGIFFGIEDNIQISDVSIDGGKLWNRVADGGNITRSHISNVTIHDSLSYGVDLANIVDSDLTDVASYNAALSGFYLHGRVTCTNCLADTSVQHGFLTNVLGGTYFKCVACIARSNGFHGYFFNTQPGALIDSEAISNSTASSGTYDGVRSVGATVQIAGGRYLDTGGMPKQNYGIYLDDSVTNAMIVLPVISGNILGASVRLGAGTSNLLLETDGKLLNTSLFGRTVSVVGDSGFAFSRINNFGEDRAAFIGQTAAGTEAMPTAIQNGQHIVSFEGRGYDGSAYSTPAGAMTITANGNWTTMSHGTTVQFSATTVGSTTVGFVGQYRDGWTFSNDVGTADMGTGTLNVKNNVYLDGSAYANPDFVLEYWARKKIVKYASHEGAARYGGVMPLSKVAAFARKNYYLPQLDYFRAHDQPAGMKEREDVSLLLHEEEFIHLIEHEDKLANLEKRLEALEKENAALRLTQASK